MIRRARLLTGVVVATATASWIATTASACGGSYQPDDTAPSGDASSDGTLAVDATPTEAAAEANPCGAALDSDPRNCGRCGHDCLGGACDAGRCAAVGLATPGGPLRHIVLAGANVFVSTLSTLTTQTRGLWRLPKAGGAAERYVPFAQAEAMAVLGDTLYFTVSEPAPNTAGDTGGIYSCPVAGPAPCQPTLVAAVNLPSAITVDQGRVFYDGRDTGSVMVYAPPGPPTPFRSFPQNAVGLAANLFVDGTAAFFTATFLAPPPPGRALVFELTAAGGQLSTYGWESPKAYEGRLTGNAAALFFTAYDFGAATDGVVRRIPRSGGFPCDLGGKATARPFGLHVDASRVYWSNQGTGAERPFSNGSIVSCEVTGCCTAATPLWAGVQQPTDITGDADAIYFVTYDGSVWKIAKP